MSRYYFIRNSLAFACIILITYLIFSFAIGRMVNHESLQGSWVSECGRHEYTFIGSSYEHNDADAGEYSLQGHKIIIGNDEAVFRARFSHDYIMIDGITFFRQN